jgi:nicotinamidase-related amidase
MARVSRLEKNLPASRTALILFDALNGYLHPANPEKQKFLAERNILPNMQRLLAGARAVGINTFYPSGAHAPDGSDTVSRLTDTDMELRPLKGGDAPIKPGFYAGSKEAEIALELAPADGDRIVPKNRWNSFHQTNLDLQLRVRGIETIVIAGGNNNEFFLTRVFPRMGRVMTTDEAVALMTK